MTQDYRLSYHWSTSGWLMAFGAAAAMHLALAVWLFYAPATVTKGQAKAAGTGGVEISLGPAGRATGAPIPQSGGPARTDLSPVDPKPVKTPQPVAAKPVLKTSAVRPAKMQPKQRQPKPQPSAVDVPGSSQADTLKNIAETATGQATDSSAPGEAGKGGDTSQHNVGSGDNSTGGSLPGDKADYAATLLAWLEQHKEYPRAARSRRQQGTVLLYFVLDQQGYVSQQRIEQSSGYAALDVEALKMLERAQPLPAMPDSMTKSQLELVVPVQFFLR